MLLFAEAADPALMTPPPLRDASEAVGAPGSVPRAGEAADGRRVAVTPKRGNDGLPEFDPPDGVRLVSGRPVVEDVRAPPEPAQ